MNIRLFTAIAVGFIAQGMMASCALDDPRSARGFRLPDGDAMAGERAFVELECNACHQVDGIDGLSDRTGAASVRLGGEVTRVRSYGELVTAIINPSHRVASGPAANVTDENGRSRMEYAALNDRMTVRQLVDLVSFLQGKYEVVPPAYDPYGYTYPGP